VPARRPTTPRRFGPSELAWSAEVLWHAKQTAKDEGAASASATPETGIELIMQAAPPAHSAKAFIELSVLTPGLITNNISAVVARRI